MLLLDDLMQLHRFLTLTQLFQQRFAFFFDFFQMLLRLLLCGIQNLLFFRAESIQLLFQLFLTLFSLSNQRFLLFFQLLIFQNLSFKLFDQFIFLGTLLAL